MCWICGDVNGLARTGEIMKSRYSGINGTVLNGVGSLL
jgi:hypothetical protein